MRFFIERLLLFATCIKRMPMSNLIESVEMSIMCVACTRENNVTISYILYRKRKKEYSANNKMLSD